MHVSQRHMNLRDSVWKQLYQKIMKITLWRKGSIREITVMCCTILFLSAKRWKFQMRKQQWTQNGKKLGKIAIVAIDQREEQKGGYSASTKRARKSPFCYADGHLSSQTCGVGTEVSKVQRPGRAPRWHCERRFRLVCCVHRARSVCVTDDGRKSNGCHCETTRLWRTNSRRRVSIRSGKGGGCSHIAQNSGVRMSRYMDRHPRH